MNIILLSGGSGKRLWPLSNEVRSKQFLKIFKKEDGTPESMVQRMYRMIGEVDPDATVTIATSANQVTAIKAQLDDKVGISIEPCRRDTFPAIALAAAYLHDMKGVSGDEAVIVCPVDPYVELDYFLMLSNLHTFAENGCSNLTLMGIEPTYPSEKYGYIIPQTKDATSKVATFKEKPDVSTAEKYISEGALWNAGVFAFKLKYVLDIAESVFGTASYHELFNNYHNLKKISFDYAVVEKESDIQVLRFSGEWRITMDKYIYDKSNGLWYELHGDYYLPCLTVPECKPVGVWGKRYRNYLKKHRNLVYTAMLLNGTLEDHVAEIDHQAEEMFDRLIEQMAEREGITEDFKASNQMAWVGAMNNIRVAAEEVVNKELIYR